MQAHRQPLKRPSPGFLQDPPTSSGVWTLLSSPFPSEWHPTPRGSQATWKRGCWCLLSGSTPWLTILLAELPLQGPAPGEAGECQRLLFRFGVSKECWPDCQDTQSSSQTSHWLACDLERVTSLLSLSCATWGRCKFPMPASSSP